MVMVSFFSGDLNFLFFANPTMSAAPPAEFFFFFLSWPPFNSRSTYCMRDVTGNHSWFCLGAMFGKLLELPTQFPRRGLTLFNHAGGWPGQARPGRDSCFLTVKSLYSLLCVERWSVQPQMFSLPQRETGGISTESRFPLSACSVVER